LKLKADHPEWTDKEVEQELQESFGVGVSPIEINEDEMTDVEIKEAKEFNKELVKNQRELKTKAREAREFLEAEKSNITLPELEMEAPKPTGKETQITPETYQEQLAQQGEKYRNEVWVPGIKTGLEQVETVKKTYEIETE